MVYGRLRERVVAGRECPSARWSWNDSVTSNEFEYPCRWARQRRASSSTPTPTPRRPQSRWPWSPSHPGPRVAAGVRTRTASPRAMRDAISRRLHGPGAPFLHGRVRVRDGGGLFCSRFCSCFFLPVQRRPDEQEEGNEPDEEGNEDRGEDRASCAWRWWTKSRSGRLRLRRRRRRSRSWRRRGKRRHALLVARLPTARRWVGYRWGTRGRSCSFLFFEEDPELRMPVCDAAPSVFVGVVGLDGGEVSSESSTALSVFYLRKFKIRPPRNLWHTSRASSLGSFSSSAFVSVRLYLRWWWWVCPFLSSSASAASAAKTTLAHVVAFSESSQIL
jgi:hypothetical protein